MLFSSCGPGGLPRTSRGVLLWSTTEFRDQGWWRWIFTTEKEDLGLRFKIWEPPGWSQDHLQVQTPYPSYPESSSAWAKECGAFILLLTEEDSEPLCGSSSIVISPCDALAAGFLSPKGRGQAPFGCIPWVGRHAMCYSTTYQRVQPFGDSTDAKSSGFQNFVCGTTENRD